MLHRRNVAVELVQRLAFPARLYRLNRYGPSRCRWCFSITDLRHQTVWTRFH